MRNLKKTLSLLLVVVMMLGLMAAANAVSFADMTDKATVTKQNEVSLLIELGIINGIKAADGTYAFQPTGTVTRAQMAKMICVMLNKGIDNPSLFVGSANFTDTKGHWAEGYIAYCYNLGIIAGYGSGKFGPDDTVTGTQAAKMLLTAIGYKAEKEGYVNNPAYAININVDAAAAGIFDSFTGNVEAALTRENAALLIYNALFAQTVTYDADNGSLLGKTYSLNGTTTNSSLSYEKFNLTKIKAYVQQNEFGSVVAQDTTSLAGYSIIDTANDFTGTENTITAKTTADMLGKQVFVYIKGTDYTKVYGTPVLTTNNKSTTISATKTNAQVKTLLTAANLSLASAGNVTVVLNNGSSANAAVAVGAIATTAGIPYEFLDNNGDGTVDLVKAFQYSVGKVTTYSATGDGLITVTAFTGSLVTTALNAQKAAKVTGFANVAKDDIVLYYEMKDQFYVEKLTPVTGAVESTQTPKITVAGTTYSPSTLVTRFDANNTDNLPGCVTIGKTAKVYLDKFGYVVFIDATTTTSNYLMILTDNSADTISAINPLTAQIIKNDGTKAVVNITKIGGTDVDDGNKTLDAAKIYTFNVTTDGKYEITEVAGGAGYTTIAAGTKITKGMPSFTTAGDVVIGGIFANDSTIFVVKGTTSWNVYTGVSNVPSMTGVTAYAVKNTTTNMAKIVFVTVQTGVTSSSNNLFVLDATPTITKDANNADVFTYSVIYKGEKTTIKGNAADLFSGDGIGLFAAPTISGAGVVTAKGTYAAPADATVAGNGVVGTAAKTFTYDANTKVWLWNSTTKTLTDASIAEIDTAVPDHICVSPTTTNANLAAYVVIFRT